jgi:hypothetical protein
VPVSPTPSLAGIVRGRNASIGVRIEEVEAIGDAIH